MMTLGRRKFDIYASHPYDALKLPVCINRPNSSITFHPIVVYLVFRCPFQRLSTTLQVTLINNKVAFGHYSNLIVKVKLIQKTAWTNSCRCIVEFCFSSYSQFIIYVWENSHICMGLNMAFSHTLNRQLSMLGPLVHVFLEMGKINKNMLFHGIKAFPLEAHLMLYRCFYIIIYSALIKISCFFIYIYFRSSNMSSASIICYMSDTSDDIFRASKR